MLLPFACCLMPHASFAQPPKKLTYDEHIQPLLRDKCFSCHNQDKQRGGVALHNYLAVMEGGSSGKIVEPGDPDASKLLRVMAHLEEPFMPPKAPKLPDEQLNLVKEWIKAGALENAGSKAKPAAKPKTEMALPAAAAGKPDGPPPMPPDSLTLEPPVLTARANAVRALAANPWSPLLAVGGQKSVLLYDADTLVLLGVLPFPEGTPQVLKFSRNGALLLCGGGHEGKSGLVVVWNVRTGERITQVGEESDAVLAADLSADQSLIALGGPSKKLRIYSTRDGKLVHEIKKHTDWVTAVEFSPDGVLLASGDRAGGLYVWEAHSGQEHLTLRGHTAFITDVAWRIDSNVLASCSEDSTVRLYEMENGGQIRGWGAHGGGALGLAFAKDGRLASVGRDRTPKLWDQSGRQLAALEATGDAALRVAFSHDGQRVISGDWNGEVRISAAAAGPPVGRVSANPPNRADQLKQSEQTLADVQKRLAKAEAELPQLEAAARKAAEAVAAAQIRVNEVASKAKSAAEASAKAKAAAAPSLAAQKAALAAVGPKEVAAKLLAEAAAKAKAAADAAKGDQELSAFAGHAQALASKAQAEHAAAGKYLQDLEAAVRPLAEQAAKADGQATQAAKELAEEQKKLAAMQGAQGAESSKVGAKKAEIGRLTHLTVALTQHRARLQASLASAAKPPQASNHK